MKNLTLTKKVRIALLAAAWWTATWLIFFPPHAKAADCSEIQVRSTVEVGDSGVSLANLLTAESCPRFRRAAAALWLGNSPPSGGQRIFEGSEIRRAIEQSLTRVASHANTFVREDIPERVIVRRSGAKASCSDIEAFIVRALGKRSQTDTSFNFSRNSSLGSSFHLDCGRAGRVPQDAPLELLKVFWDPALETWEYSLRCVRANDCVPFLIRQSVRQPAQHITSGSDSGATPGSAFVARQRPAHQVEAPPTVRAGQTATLYWDEDGIRSIVPVICLDHGGVGTLIRARIKNGNRVLRAEVVSAGVLRAAL